MLRPSRCALLFASVIGLAFLMASLPVVQAAPGAGSLSFGGAVTFDGTLSGSGAGELRAPGLDTVFSGTAQQVAVQRVWYETEVVRSPLGGPVRTETGPVQTAWYNHTDASVQLEFTETGHETFLYTTDGRLDLEPTDAADLRLVAFADPALVVDEEGELRTDARVFTYGAPGDRFPVAAPSWHATGDMVVYVAHASFLVRQGDADPVRFVSGDRAQETSPTSHKEVHSYHLLHLSGAALTLEAQAATGWFAAPVWSLVGTLTAERASGSLAVDEKDYALDAAPVTVGGTIEVRPRAIGTPEPVARDAGTTHVGTSNPRGSVYTTMGSDIAGDVTVLAIGTELPFVAKEGLAVAATIGVLTLAGAVFLLTPKGQWLAVGIFAPLYAKTEKDRLLANESRERLFQTIRNNPGINLSQVNRIADLGWGVTVYHLKMMEKKGLVFSEAGARERCFFENEPKFRQLRHAIAAIANREPAQKVAGLVADRPGLSQRDIVEQTGLTQRVVSYYVTRLAKQGLVERERAGNFVRYRPTPHLAEALRYVHAAETRTLDGVGGTPAAVDAHA